MSDVRMNAQMTRLSGPGRMIRRVEQPVVVTWRDAHFQYEHHVGDTWDHDVYLTHTYGVLLPDAPPGHLAVAGEALADGSYKSVTLIPECIVEGVE